MSEIPFTLDKVDLELEAIQEDFCANQFTEVKDHFDRKNHPDLTDEDEEDILPDLKKLLDKLQDHNKLSEHDQDCLLDVITENDCTFSKSEYDMWCVKGVNMPMYSKIIFHLNLGSRIFHQKCIVQLKTTLNSCYREVL